MFLPAITVSGLMKSLLVRSCFPALAVVSAGVSGSAAAATLSNQAVLADNPLLYWTFDEADGLAHTLVNDYGADAEGFTNNLSPSRTLAVSRTVSTAVGGISLGNAAIFSRTNDEISSRMSTTLTPSYSLDTYAIEFWFYSDDSTAS